MQGRWRLPGSWTGRTYPDLGIFKEVASIAERGRIDMLFFGDGTGIPSTWRGSIEEAVRWGIGWPNPRRRRLLHEALAAVGASGYADLPGGVLSGGEQQRVRMAQALATDPRLLLCDEALLSLDLNHQAAITALLDRRRREHGTAIVFVTHEINPILPYVDRVLYLAGGRFRIGTVEEVMTSRTLSALYGMQVEVLRSGGRIIVAGVPDVHVHAHEHDEVVST